MENYNLRRDKSVGRRREVAALLLLFGTLLLALGMISYLVPFFGAKPELQAPQQNWIGALGFYSAHFLFSFLGLSAFFPLSLLALSTIRIVCGQKRKHETCEKFRADQLYALFTSLFNHSCVEKVNKELDGSEFNFIQREKTS